MLIAMSIPMVILMKFRRYGWMPLVEMLAGMALPAAAAVVLAAFAIVPGLTDANLTVWSHVAMLAGMLAVMLARWTHYGAEHAHGRVGP